MNKDIQNIVPFFSVVIPVYNKGPHIRQTIESVLSQSFRDFELILINDASTDNSLSEIRSFNDKRIRLYERDVPGPGGYAARNLGIQKAHANWVAMLDADDQWLDDHLQNMHDLIIKFPDVKLFGAGWIYKNYNSEAEDRFYSFNRKKGMYLMDLKEYLTFCLDDQQPICSSIACINRTSPLALDLFPVKKNIRRGGDKFAWLKMMCFHKQMAWSNHLGAVYNLDSSNMVTKTSPPSPELAEKSIVDLLSKGLNKEEKVLLVKYMNKIIKHEWFIGIKLRKEHFNIRPLLFWKYDLGQAIKYSLISLLPRPLIRKILFGRDNEEQQQAE